MMRRFWILALVISAFVFSSYAYGADYYLSPDTLPAQLLPPPYAENSVDWQKDVRYILAIQQNVNAEDLREIRDEQHVRLELITSVLGPDFTQEACPGIFGLLSRVYADTYQIVENDKSIWGTRRPYLANKDIQLLVDRIDQSPSYPSGHTALSRVVAEVLGMIFPDEVTLLRARAEMIGAHRVEAGVHYPIDIKGGQLLAMLVVGALRQNPSFEEDLQLASTEAKTCR